MAPPLARPVPWETLRCPTGPGFSANPPVPRFARFRGFAAFVGACTVLRRELRWKFRHLGRKPLAGSSGQHFRYSLRAHIPLRNASHPAGWKRLRACPPVRSGLLPVVRTGYHVGARLFLYPRCGQGWRKSGPFSRSRYLGNHRGVSGRPGGGSRSHPGRYLQQKASPSVQRTRRRRLGYNRRGRPCFYQFSTTCPVKYLCREILKVQK